MLLTSGEYSDYGPHGVVKCLKDFKTSEVLEEYLNKFPEQRAEYHGKHSQFLAYLSEEGYIEDIEFTEWNIGSYSTLDGLADD